MMIRRSSICTGTTTTSGCGSQIHGNRAQWVHKTGLVLFCTVHLTLGTGIPMSAVLLSAAEPPDGVRDLLSGAGLPVMDHVLGAIPAVEFGGISATLIEVGDDPDAAAAQTRRWRAELGDD